MSTANPDDPPATSGVFGLTRAIAAKATDRLKLARTRLCQIPMLTLVLGTQAAEVGQSIRSDEGPHRNESDGTLNLEWVDLNWDAFK